MSSTPGSLVFAFFWAARKMEALSSEPLWAMASFSAAIDFSRPTKSGTTWWGKTMMSRSGRSGTVWVGRLASRLSSRPKSMCRRINGPGSWAQGPRDTGATGPSFAERRIHPGGAPRRFHGSRGTEHPSGRVRVRGSRHPTPGDGVGIAPPWRRCVQSFPVHAVWRGRRHGPMSLGVEFLPVDVTQLVAVALGCMIPLIFVVGITMRFAAKPLVEALGKLRENGAPARELEVLSRRVLELV